MFKVENVMPCQLTKNYKKLILENKPLLKRLNKIGYDDRMSIPMSR